MRETIKTIIWDLDGTLYKFSDNSINNWNELAGLYARNNGIELTEKEAFELAEKGWLDHRDSRYYFMQDHNMCGEKFHYGVFDLMDTSELISCQETPSLMKEMQNHHHVILTYATRDWAKRVLDHTGLNEFFHPDFIIGAEDYNFEDKAHSPRGILTALDKLGGNGNDVLFVEDTLPNLITAKQHSPIKAAYLHHNRPLNDNDMGAVDLCVQDTPELLKWFKEIPQK